MPAQQFIIPADEGLCAAGITLASGTAKELSIRHGAIRAALFAITCSPPKSATPAPETNVRAAPCHVRGDGDAPSLSGQCDDSQLLRPDASH